MMVRPLRLGPRFEIIFFYRNFEITIQFLVIICFISKKENSDQFVSKSKMLQPEEALAKALDNLSSEDWEKNVEGETLS